MRKREWQSNHIYYTLLWQVLKLCCAVYQPELNSAQMLSQTGSHIEHLWGCLYISYTHTIHQNMQKDPGDGHKIPTSASLPKFIYPIFELLFSPSLVLTTKLIKSLSQLQP
jgi:hypothetical protein